MEVDADALGERLCPGQGIMMRCGGSDMWGYIWHAARGLLTPFGLLMVLQTPVVSGASGGNVDIREGKPVSNIELLYQAVSTNWCSFLWVSSYY